MNIVIDDEVASILGMDAEELKQYLAVALYKYKGIHGALAGKIIDKSEFEFHGILSSFGETVNYDIDDLMDDIKNNDLF